MPSFDISEEDKAEADALVDQIREPLDLLSVVARYVFTIKLSRLLNRELKELKQMANRGELRRCPQSGDGSLADRLIGECAQPAQLPDVSELQRELLWLAEHRWPRRREEICRALGISVRSAGEYMRGYRHRAVGEQPGGPENNGHREATHEQP